MCFSLFLFSVALWSNLLLQLFDVCIFWLLLTLFVRFYFANCELFFGSIQNWRWNIDFVAILAFKSFISLINYFLILFCSPVFKSVVALTLSNLSLVLDGTANYIDCHFLLFIVCLFWFFLCGHWLLSSFCDSINVSHIAFFSLCVDYIFFSLVAIISLFKQVSSPHFFSGFCVVLPISFYLFCAIFCSNKPPNFFSSLSLLNANFTPLFPSFV
jgi:hypothetical protein